MMVLFQKQHKEFKYQYFIVLFNRYYEGICMAKKEADDKGLKNIVRVLETNLDGSKPVGLAIGRIKGVSFMLANAISLKFGASGKKVGDLSEDEIKKLEDIIGSPQKHGIPSWMMNRRGDPELGEDRHLTVSTLDFTRTMDINEMKKKKSYRGVRHIQNLPVRGQRTRGSFRRGKVVGVSKKKARQ
jgi:small subunit ribosomal protein S13